MQKFLGIVGLAWVTFFGLWLFVYTTGINTLAIQSEDTLPAMFIPVTVIKEGTLYADTYYPMILEKYPHPDDKKQVKGLTPFYFKKIGEHYISAFPLVAGIVSIPVYFVPLLLGMPINWENLILLSHLSAALICALSGGFFYLLGKKLTSPKKALVLTFIFLFATVNLPMVAQALWQHGVVQLFIILSLLLLYHYRETKKLYSVLLSGVFLGLAVLSRPTAGLLLPFFVLLAVYFAAKQLDQKLSFSALRTFCQHALLLVAGLVPSAAFFLWYNKVFFATIANQGYSGQIASNWLTPFPVGFLGLWFSPSKGILVYSPVFLFALVGVFLAVKLYVRHKSHVEYLIYSAIVLTHTLIIGSWKHWYGGWSFGYRMASDILPFLVLLLVPFVNSPRFYKVKTVFLFTVFVSVLIGLMGIAFFDGVWHGTFDGGFWQQDWLWSVENSELVFNLNRMLVKLSLLL